MGYFRKLDTRLNDLFELFSRDERWLIIINADPDALASAKALKRIMARRCRDTDIAQVNEISRPDNLEMISSLRIHSQVLTPKLAEQYDKFAIVDSQPHHHKDFAPYHFSIVIDHHPLLDDHPVDAEYIDIKPEYGANSTILTEYLHHLKIRPGEQLATALLYGIKTDTSSFERPFHDADVRAFQYLSKYSNQLLLRKIYRSEFHMEWLEYFSKAFYKMHAVDRGMFAHMGEVENPDILVVLADFFLRVHGISWNIISGRVEDKLVLIFRGDGLTRDMGKFAAFLFQDIGAAGGHETMARAELPLDNIDGNNYELFLLKRIEDSKNNKSAFRISSQKEHN
jgi:nanoRNase/pAp phosphatase (c-di-AMP/oligoRNAs hydrolase)